MNLKQEIQVILAASDNELTAMSYQVEALQILINERRKQGLAVQVITQMPTKNKQSGKKTYSANTREKLIALIKEDVYTPSEIANQLGLTKQQVYSMKSNLKRGGVKS